MKVIEAEAIKKSKKLLKLKIDLNGEQRSVISGIATSYKPEDILGKNVAMVMNLKPRKIMGVESQAMILAAHDEGIISALVPDIDVKPGSEIS